ncbi:Fic/DOC family protein [Acidicapsa acidisoli]|uniref:Fic/DOC family protein n=1 Tax=Acidicapsa acidisoli TaxID=1615681 RepID=UPI0021E0BD2B|nr:Fic family protein [Acidicapsa acidisoli]
MSRYSGDDTYLDPASGVLKNRFGIVDAAILEMTEADLVAARSRELAQSPLPGQFDLKHLQAIHRYLFGDLYDWAGELRTVDISKNDNMFAHHAHIASAAKSILERLAAEKCLTGLSRDEFSSRAAYYFGEINALHPFREGNGRTQREFISHLAQANGYYVAWEDVRPAEMLQALMESFRGNLSRLTAILRENLH